MPDLISFTVKPPFRDVAGKFAKATADLLEAKRASLRVLGQAGVARLKAEAPRGKTGKFAASHSFKTFESGNVVTLKFYSASPLGEFIRLGTKPHRIQARSARALAFHWPKVGMMTFVPRAGFPVTGEVGGAFWIGKGYVNHPGTPPNPYHERAFQSMSPAMRDELRKMAKGFVETVKSA